MDNSEMVEPNWVQNVSLLVILAVPIALAISLLDRKSGTAAFFVPLSLSIFWLWSVYLKRRERTALAPNPPADGRGHDAEGSPSPEAR